MPDNISGNPPYSPYSPSSSPLSSPPRSRSNSFSDSDSSATPAGSESSVLSRTTSNMGLPAYTPNTKPSQSTKEKVLEGLKSFGRGFTGLLGGTLIALGAATVFAAAITGGALGLAFGGPLGAIGGGFAGAALGGIVGIGLSSLGFKLLELAGVGDDAKEKAQKLADFSRSAIESFQYLAK